MKTLSLTIFLIATTIHLYASAKSDKKLRNITKPFIVTALLMYYCFATSDIKLIVVLALIFAWLGDLLLILKGNKYFTIGGISFMISHFFLVLSYNEEVIFERIDPIVIIALSLFFIGIVSYIFSHLKRYLPKALFFSMFLYLLINGMMNCFAIFRMLSNINIATITTCIGSILFFISDSSLFFIKFNKDSIQKTHFWVMFTYSIGVLLIVLGLID